MPGLSPQFSILGVPVSIYTEGLGDRAVVERWPSSGPEADVVFKAPYDQRYTVIKGLRGGMVATGRTFTYLPPLRYPPSPNLLCTAIGDVTGIKPSTDQSSGWLTYQFAIIPAHFSVPTWDAIGGPVVDPSGLPFTTTKFKASAEVFTPPSGSYYYIDGPDAGKVVAESSVGIIRSRVEISMTRHFVPFPFLNDIMEWDGTVNDAPVTFGDRTFPRGCLMFAGADTDPVSNPISGERCWDYTFLFLGNFSIEWNEFMGLDGEWHLINDKADGSGSFPFEYVDYNALFGFSF